MRKLSVQRVDFRGARHPCPLRWIDNFAMRNFTNDAIFDDTLPVARWVAGGRPPRPLDRLQPAMEDWFRRKGYLKPMRALRLGIARYDRCFLHRGWYAVG